MDNNEKCPLWDARGGTHETLPNPTVFYRAPAGNEARMNTLVDAIRNHPKVGVGSCTSIDECYTDQELIDALAEGEITTVEEAIAWAIETEGIRIENALNYRCGNDDDPELERYREWNEG